MVDAYLALYAQARAVSRAQVASSRCASSSARRRSRARARGAVSKTYSLQQAQIARRGEREAVAGAADEAERAAGRRRRRHEHVEARVAARPHHLVDAGHLELERHLAPGRTAGVRPLDAAGPIDDRSTASAAGLVVVDELPAQRLDVDPGTLATEVVACRKLSGAAAGAGHRQSSRRQRRASADVRELRHRDLRQEHRVGHRAIGREPPDVERIDRRDDAAQRRAARTRLTPLWFVSPMR